MVQNNFKQAGSKKVPPSPKQNQLGPGSNSFLSVTKSQKKIATIIAIRQGSVEPRKDESTPKKQKVPSSMISNIQQKYQNKPIN